MNDLYTSQWRLYHNFFLPSVKLLEKITIASKTIKRYDTPKTPYQRIMKSPHISDTIKQALTKEFDQLNPFKLRKKIEKKLANIFNQLK